MNLLKFWTYSKSRKSDKGKIQCDVQAMAKWSVHPLYEPGHVIDFVGSLTEETSCLWMIT
jgi:hypothetical protein